MIVLVMLCMYIYVCKKCEKFGGCWRLFLWLGQKVIDNNTHPCTVHADQEDLTTSFVSKMA